MAYLTNKEFERAIEMLADEYGLQRLRDKFFKMRGLVTRRGFKTPDALARQLFTLSSGLRREVPSSFAFQAIWSEHIGENVGGEDAEEKFEKLADDVNTCLDDSDGIAEGKDAEMAKALTAYEAELAASVGGEKARIDMLMKAVPAVAELLRSMPIAGAPAAAEAEAKEEASPSQPPAAEPEGEKNEAVEDAS